MEADPVSVAAIGKLLGLVKPVFFTCGANSGWCIALSGMPFAEFAVSEGFHDMILSSSTRLVGASLLKSARLAAPVGAERHLATFSCKLWK